MLSTKTLANAVRFLSIDAVQKANSGHPGMPMGMADIATVLWRDHLNHNPADPKWINRDRFVLSNGHGSMLLYSLLHLTGYDLSIDDLKNFRQLHSKTPGHPEYGYAPGVETTTGPLGQGIANAVGMALAETVMADRFNSNDIQLIDHYTYAFVGDGCLMEGVSHEACSLAGTLGLGKLIVFWDDNGISIDGEIKAWFNEDVAKRYQAYGWQVIENIDGHDPEAINAAIVAAKNNDKQPTLICCKTHIGFGSPTKVGTAGVHGSPLGEAEIEATREALGWLHAPFEISTDIYQAWNAKEQGAQKQAKWALIFKQYQSAYPESAELLARTIKADMPLDFDHQLDQYLDKLVAEKPKVATRKASQMALEIFSPFMPELFGGSADLTGSNLTNVKQSIWFNHQQNGANYLSYGVREFAMAAMMNGMSLYGGIKPYGGTFLVFTDYARNAIRMSALMKLPVVYVMTHDSIGLGEDGPTHQPIEHLPSLRLIPNLDVWRPADVFETAVAWAESLKSKTTPSILALSRQNLPMLVSTTEQSAQIRKGGYILSPKQNAVATIVATGSEVEIAIDAQQQLEMRGISVSVVSMPCVEKFKQQSDLYQKEVISDTIPAVFIEASQPDLWYSLLPKAGGDVIGMRTFGESAPADELYKTFGLTAKEIIKRVLALTNN